LTAVGDTTARYLAELGTYGSWSDIQIITRWGDGACGMYEAQWTMPLPPYFDHPVLRRGALVEIMDGPYRVGSPLILTEPARGTGLDNPWQFVATGIGREVEGSNSFYAADGSGNATTVPTTAVDQAITDGWRISGRDSSVPATSPSALTTSDNLNTVGAVVGAAADVAGKRWGVRNDNLLYFTADPTAPSYQVTPGAVSLGVADDDYASTVKVRYLDSTTGTFLTRTATNSQTAARYGVRQAMVDITDRGPMTSTAAQNVADQVLALDGGRLGWTNSLTVTSNELLTMGGVPANLSKAAEDVGLGCMVRLHGISNDLLEYNGQTWLDVIIGQASYVDGAPTIQLDPLGLAARDLAAIVESIAGPAAA
jgi:hypothetical protein